MVQAHEQLHGLGLRDFLSCFVLEALRDPIGLRPQRAIPRARFYRFVGELEA